MVITPPAVGEGEVEAVARAIVRRRCEAFRPEEFPHGIDWQVDRGWKMAQNEARIAIETLATLRPSPDAIREALAEAQQQLGKAADQFAFYADAHAKKRTSDGDAKAMVNHQWALACAKADHLCRTALASNQEPTT